MASVYEKAIHTYTNLPLKAAGFFEYVWHFCGHNIVGHTVILSWEMPSNNISLFIPFW